MAWFNRFLMSFVKVEFITLIYTKKKANGGAGVAFAYGRYGGGCWCRLRRDSGLKRRMKRDVNDENKEVQISRYAQRCDRHFHFVVFIET